jgi:hypothetical protein
MLKCAWCSKELENTTAQIKQNLISHGICLDCLASMGLFEEINLENLTPSYLISLPIGTAEISHDFSIKSFSTDNEDTGAYLSEMKIVGENYFDLFSNLLDETYKQQLINKVLDLISNPRSNFFEHLIILKFKDYSNFVLSIEGYYYTPLESVIIELKIINELGNILY